MASETSARHPETSSAERPVDCDDCAAVCCRLEVLCITETGVPRRFQRFNAGGVPSMNRLDDGWCAALNRDTLRCGIYEQRPLICRELEMGGPECLAERARWANS